MQPPGPPHRPWWRVVLEFAALLLTPAVITLAVISILVGLPIASLLPDRARAYLMPRHEPEGGHEIKYARNVGCIVLATLVVVVGGGNLIYYLWIKP